MTYKKWDIRIHKKWDNDTAKMSVKWLAIVLGCQHLAVFIPAWNTFYVV